MTWTICPAPVDGAAAAAALRAYLVDIVGRYHGRPATGEEVDAALADSPSTDLAPPDGTFLLARADGPGTVTGCAGVRLLAPAVAELKRLWVHPDTRGRGLGGRLLGAAEDAALALGASVLRLDTRSDLVEARRLYARHGYAEIAPYHYGDPYAEHFFEKRLG